RLRGEVVDPPVLPAVAGDLVPVPGDRADQRGAVPGDLPHDEEGGLEAGVGQLSQQPVRRGAEALAVMRLESRVEREARGRLDPEVLLDIEAEDDLRGRPGRLPVRGEGGVAAWRWDDHGCHR